MTLQKPFLQLSWVSWVNTKFGMEIPDTYGHVTWVETLWITFLVQALFYPSCATAK